MYLAVVIDLFSRRVVGWSMATHMRTELVLGALEMALGRRFPGPGLLHHSDRGSQYASHDYRKALEDHHIICSMSRKGNCWDNSVVESFFGKLKTELIYRRPWPSIKMARVAIADSIEVFYNRKRRHSFLGNISPAEFEKRFEKKAALAGRVPFSWASSSIG
jgi:putative transposase